MKTYAQTPIPGKILPRALPQGTALVLEGGGLRGYYSSGVMENFIEQGILFPYIIGVSAGAANALSYISGQPMRSRQIVENYVGNPAYVSKRNLLFKRSMFDFNYIFETIPQEYVFFDWDTFRAQNTRFLTGALNCRTGKTQWFEKEALKAPFTVSRASCSVPIMTPVQHYDGMDLLDGGIVDPIPIEKSIADGNTFHVIVLTRNKGYRKTPLGHDAIVKGLFRKYPAVAQALLQRHENYNRQLELCEQLEAQGKALILRPLEPIRVKRTGAEIPQLLALYDEGIREGKAVLPRILELLDTDA